MTTRSFASATIVLALFAGCDGTGKDIGQPINLPADEGSGSGGVGGSDGVGGEGSGNIGGGSSDGGGSDSGGYEPPSCEEQHDTCLANGTLAIICDSYLTECQVAQPCLADFDACRATQPPLEQDDPCQTALEACTEDVAGPLLADCCAAHEGPGCGRASIMDFVCYTDPSCCTEVWSNDCARLVGLNGSQISSDWVTTDFCGNEIPLPGVNPSDDASCCSFHLTPGCDDPGIEACVCAQSPECCTDVWTPTCTMLVGAYECAAACPELVEGPCCDVEQQDGCLDPDIESCVCAVDPFCCDHWDGQCAAQVEPLGCGACSG